MRTLVISLAVVAAVAAGTNGAAGATSCEPPGARVVERNSFAALVHRTDAYYACAYRTNVLYPLTRADEPDLEVAARPDFSMRGTNIGFALHACDGSDCWPLLGVIDANTGKVRDAYPAAECAVLDEGSCQQFTDLAVSRGGSLAWVQLEAGSGHRRVVKCARACLTAGRGIKSTILDRGRRIRATSLRVRGSTLTWLEGHQRKQASFR